MYYETHGTPLEVCRGWQTEGQNMKKWSLCVRHHLQMTQTPNTQVNQKKWVLYIFTLKRTMTEENFTMVSLSSLKTENINYTIIMYINCLSKISELTFLFSISFIKSANWVPLDLESLGTFSPLLGVFNHFQPKCTTLRKFSSSTQSLGVKVWSFAN